MKDRTDIVFIYSLCCKKKFPPTMRLHCLCRLTKFSKMIMEIDRHLGDLSLSNLHEYFIVNLFVVVLLFSWWAIKVSMIAHCFCLLLLLTCALPVGKF